MNYISSTVRRDDDYTNRPKRNVRRSGSSRNIVSYYPRAVMNISSSTVRRDGGSSSSRKRNTRRGGSSMNNYSYYNGPIFAPNM